MEKKEIAQKIWTINELLKWTQDYFTKKGISTPRLDTEVLLSHLLNKERIYLYVHFDEPVEEKELKAFKQMVQKRANRIPVAYIIGEKEFMGLKLKVSDDVLIPRPDTEILVESVLDRLPMDKNIKICDIGTGSGAIIIALLKIYENAKGYAIDVSEKALKIAKENATMHNINEKIEFLHGNLFEPLLKRKEKFLAIISNPPYISSQDFSSLEPEVKLCEPSLALTDNGDGLSFYRRILKDGKDFLLDNGFLALEIGKNQAQSVIKIAKDENWGKIEIVKDLSSIERVLIIWKQK